MALMMMAWKGGTGKVTVFGQKSFNPSSIFLFSILHRFFLFRPCRWPNTSFNIKFLNDEWLCRARQRTHEPVCVCLSLQHFNFVLVSRKSLKASLRSKNRHHRKCLRWSFMFPHLTSINISHSVRWSAFRVQVGGLGCGIANATQRFEWARWWGEIW